MAAFQAIILTLALGALYAAVPVVEAADCPKFHYPYQERQFLRDQTPEVQAACLKTKSVGELMRLASDEYGEFRPTGGGPGALYNLARKEVATRPRAERLPFVTNRRRKETPPSLWKALTKDIVDENAIVEQALGDDAVFESLRDGMAIDFNDPQTPELLYLYVNSQMSPDSTYYPIPMSGIAMVLSAMKSNGIPEKPRLDAWMMKDLTTGETVRLRLLRAWESPFRGCLGKDCSTGSRFLRALEPAHLYFAIEGVPQDVKGQIEIVLGRDPHTGERLAFLERFQSPDNLRPRMIAGILDGLTHQLRHLGYTFVSLGHVSDYYAKGHPLCNFQLVGNRIQEAIDRYFIHSAPVSYQRDADLYPIHDDEFFVFIANKISADLEPQAVKLSLRNSADLARELAAWEEPLPYAAPLARRSIAETVSRLWKKLEVARQERRPDLRSLEIVEKSCNDDLKKKSITSSPAALSE